jgi:hypothetical protein
LCPKLKSSIALLQSFSGLSTINKTGDTWQRWKTWVPTSAGTTGV